ncbi:MAG: helix-turn-helix transcriptional regulator [Vicinamibacterales bacterium]
MLTAEALAGLCRAREILRDPHQPHLTIGQVARVAAMSPFHFIRQFTAVFGETPHQVRIRARLDRAKEGLALGDDPVTQVCLDVGFSSLGSFSTLFARRVGMPPSAYRRRARAMVVVPGMPPPQLFPGCLSLMTTAFATFEKQSAGGSVTLG